MAPPLPTLYSPFGRGLATSRWRLPLLLLALLALLTSGQEEGVPESLLEHALEEGFRIAGQQRDYETILGFQLRGGAELDPASSQLFDFRRPHPDSKTSSVCLGTSLLEVSKYIRKKLPGTTVESVQRLTSQSLGANACRRLLKDAGGDCSNVRVGDVPRCDPRAPYRSLDGTCNNVRNPRWGASSSPFSRYLRAAYEDGLDEPRGAGRSAATALPSARKVSTVMTQGSSMRQKPGLAITSLVMQFGQFLDHDLVHTPESAVRGSGNSLLPFGCCERGVPPSLEDQQRVPDCRPIDLRGDPLFDSLGRSCMRFVRSMVADRGCKLGAREQLNQVTSYIDSSVLYGTSQFLSNHLKDNENKGQMRHTSPEGSNPSHGTSCPHSFCNADLLPQQRCHSQTTAQCFISGDGRLSEQPGLTVLHILFMRIHNSIASELAVINPSWDAEIVFQESRRIVGALEQQVTYREFLPVVLGSGPMDHFKLWVLQDGHFNGYNDSVNPTTPNVFATAAFRFGHSLVDDVLMEGPEENVTLLNSFNNGELLKRPGTRPSQFIKYITTPTSQASDEFLVPGLTNSLFGSPRFPIGLDLYAINIMRGRDHGLASYNEWRVACGLPRARSFEDLTSMMSDQAAHKFRSLYKSVDDIDLFPGALAEPVLGNGILGPTFACLIGQHFHDIKVGDRFWYENGNQPKPFTLDQLHELRNTWFSSLLCHHTNIAVMQPSPFLAAHQSKNPLRSCPSYRKLDLRPWGEDFTSTTSKKTPKPTPGTDRPTVSPGTARPPKPSPRPPVPTVKPPATITRPPVTITSGPATRPPVPSARPPVSGRPPVAVYPSDRPPVTPVQQPNYPSTVEVIDLDRPQTHPTSQKPVDSGKPGSHPVLTIPPEIDRPQIHPTIPTPTSQRPLVFPAPPTSPRPQVFPISFPGPTTKRPTFEQPSYYPQQILPPFGKRCRAAGVWRRLQGMDVWCTNNCYHAGSSHCPASHCTCS